jgi:pilus assembly protein CpaE
MTVPALRHTQRLARAIQERAGRELKLGVLVNRADPKGGEYGVKEKDVRDVLGSIYAGRISNNYRVVREALDRGVPLREVSANCDVLMDLRRAVMPEEARPERSGLSLPLNLLSPRRWLSGKAAMAR